MILPSAGLTARPFPCGTTRSGSRKKCRVKKKKTRTITVAASQSSAAKHRAQSASRASQGKTFGGDGSGCGTHGYLLGKSDQACLYRKRRGFGQKMPLRAVSAGTAERTVDMCFRHYRGTWRAMASSMARKAASGRGKPVQRVNCAPPWLANMSRPLSVFQPAASAASRNGVRK